MRSRSGYPRTPQNSLKHRIAQFIGSFNQGGTERQAVSLIGDLTRMANFEISVATLDRSGVLLGDVERLPVGTIPEFRLNSFFDLNFVRQVRLCASWLRKERVNLVHTHDFYTNIFGMAAASLAGVRARVASKRETGGMRSRAQAMVERIAFHRAHRIVANSEAVCEHLAASGVAGHKVEVIYNSLDMERFDRTSDIEFPGLPKGRRLITLVANLRHDVKNVPMLLRAAAQVAGRIPDADFVIAGEGDLEAELRRLASDLGIDHRVHFIGRCTDVPGLLASSFAGVLTSTNEGFSNSILEYMAAGLPVVATDVGGAREAVASGETGYLITSDDDAGLARSLIDLLEDPRSAARFGDAGRARAKAMFSPEARLMRTSALYESLLNT